MTDQGTVLPSRHGQVSVDTDDDVVTVRVTGDIDIAVAPALAAGLASAAEAKPTPSSVVVDLTAVPFLDSSALGTLLAGARRLSDLGIAFQVVIPDDAPARRVVELVGLVDVLNVTRTADTSD